MLLEELHAATGGAGVITMDALVQVLSSSRLELTDMEVNSLLSCATQEAGGVDYTAIVSYAFYILQYLAQNAAIA